MHHTKPSLKDTLSGTYHAVEEKIEDVLYEKWHIRLHKKARHHIHKLRKHPDHHKDMIAFFVASLVTLCVFIGWYIVSYPKIIASYQLQKREHSALNTSTNPIDTLKTKIIGEPSQKNIEVQ